MGNSIKNYTKKEIDYLYKRTLKIVVLAQTLGGAGLAAGITVGALIAKEMLGSEGLAGLPAALFTLGSALSAYLVGRMSQRRGRRLGLSLGFIVGGLGAIGVIVATTLNNIWLLFLMLFIYGAGTSTNLQARYAGTDLADEKQRGKAVSIAMVSTTLGAVLGPNLVTPMGNIAMMIGIPKLAGPFILAAVAYILAGLTLFLFLRPDPFLVAKQLVIQEMEQEKSDPHVQTESRQRYNRKGVIIGALVLVLSHFVMVAIMTMTPVYMQGYGASLTAVGLVIGLHIAAMYLPSLGTGVLVDKIGRNHMVVASSITLAISGLMAAFVPGDSVVLMTIALMLLGLGWNFGLISGTAIIVDSTSILTRAKTQGSVDVWVAFGGTAGSMLSGLIVVYMNYLFLGIIGTLIAIILIPLIILMKYDNITETQ